MSTFNPTRSLSADLSTDGMLVSCCQVFLRLISPRMYYRGVTCGVWWAIYLYWLYVYRTALLRFDACALNFLALPTNNITLDYW
jgi:hypothetical protein